MGALKGSSGGALSKSRVLKSTMRYSSRVLVYRAARRPGRARIRPIPTFHRWKRKYGAMDIADAKRLKELKKENAELKKMLAEAMLKNRVLEEVNAKKW
ncbi:MAG TPA: hypothetical protein EYQ18_20310 [Candidatus Handelsmanbacteria bacterium]|nr:hypothetical protein [Candidatus Handelsmanbacteria bacterium]